MNSEFEVIDSVEDEDRTVIFSKITIALITLISTPIVGLIFYCINLKRTNQSGKIFGTIAFVTLCYFFVTVGFLGFELPDPKSIPLLYIPKITTTLLMIYPLWIKHFKKEDYSTELGIKWIIIALLLFVGSLYFGRINPIPDVNVFMFPIHAVFFNILAAFYYLAIAAFIRIAFFTINAPFKVFLKLKKKK